LNNNGSDGVVQPLSNIPERCNVSENNPSAIRITAFPAPQRNHCVSFCGQTTTDAVVPQGLLTHALAMAAFLPDESRANVANLKFIPVPPHILATSWAKNGVLLSESPYFSTKKVLHVGVPLTFDGLVGLERKKPVAVEPPLTHDLDRSKSQNERLRGYLPEYFRPVRLSLKLPESSLDRWRASAGCTASGLEFDRTVKRRRNQRRRKATRTNDSQRLRDTKFNQGTSTERQNGSMPNPQSPITLCLPNSVICF
jgi:hypothetical protein